MKKPFKVLFIYPGLFMQLGLPLGIASLAAALKKEGIEVKIFDTVFYQEPGDIDENVERAKVLHSVKQVDYSSIGVSRKHSRMGEDFIKVLSEYKPDLIGLSSIECIFERGIKLTRIAKNLTSVPIVTGGVFATLAPEIAIKEPSIDIVCVGEGEEALVELCKCLKEQKDYSNIGSLWVKTGDAIIRNKPFALKSIDQMAIPDFSSFNPDMFYRPMRGNLFKTIPVEFARGCPYQCTYCAEPSLNRLYRNNGERSYFRAKSMAKVMGEMEENIKKYNPEFFYFASETFLAMSDDRFNEFIAGYKNIKIPFWIQTRIETITAERLQKLKEVGLFWITIGIEHGNENFCRKYLKRNTKNKETEKVIKMLDNLEQGASLNSIIGFPYENRKLIFDTISLNRRLFQINKRIRCNISLFTPFRGCELYELCVSSKLFEPVPYTNHTNITKGSIIRSDFLSREELNGLFRVFNFYVHLPREYENRIKLAEQFTAEGDREFTLLSGEVEKYLC